MPTWTAFAKVQLLERHFAHLIDYEFTASMEEALDSIARGEGEAEKWLHSFYFGNGAVGLRELVAEDHVAQIDKADVNAIAVGHDADGNALTVRVWPNGANIERGDDKAPIPADLAPDELTPERAEELLARGSVGPRVLGTDPDSDLPVLALSGRFGPFVQLGDVPDGSKEKPKRASLFASMDPATHHVVRSARAAVAATSRGQRRRRRRDHRAERALRPVPEEGHRYPQPRVGGPALHRDPRRRGGAVRAAEATTWPGGEAAAGRSRRASRSRGRPSACSTAGTGPTSPTAPRTRRYPRGTDPESLTLEQGIELLRERAARAPATKRSVKKAAKRTAKKSTVKKAKKSAAKTTAKKTAAKKTAKNAEKVVGKATL